MTTPARYHNAKGQPILVEVINALYTDREFRNVRPGLRSNAIQAIYSLAMNRREDKILSRFDLTGFPQPTLRTPLAIELEDHMTRIKTSDGINYSALIRVVLDLAQKPAPKWDPCPFCGSTNIKPTGVESASCLDCGASSRKWNNRSQPVAEPIP